LPEGIPRQEIAGRGPDTGCPLGNGKGHPELGFWEVEPASLREFSRQFRTFEIVRNSGNTVSVFTLNVDPSVRKGSHAAISRSYAIAAHQISNLTAEPGPVGSYNAELVKQLSLEMQVKIQNAGTPIAG
jgi:hypothetical protein